MRAFVSIQIVSNKMKLYLGQLFPVFLLLVICRGQLFYYVTVTSAGVTNLLMNQNSHTTQPRPQPLTRLSSDNGRLKAKHD